ncbi:Hypothetical predicted protein, partial [Paramuricea clavata]
DPFSMRYISVDDVIRSLVVIGPGALMAKFDVQAAYRNIPINVSDRHLLGMYWRESFYVDLVLPAVRRYLQVRGNAPGSLFVLSDGSPLTPVVVNCWLRAILSNLSIRGTLLQSHF